MESKIRNVALNSVKIILLTFFLGQVILIAHCTTDKNQNVRIQQFTPDESFETFYKEFYSDSVFQISRITFPLKGFNSDDRDPELGDKNPPYFWKKNEWNFIKTLEKDYLKIDKKDWVEEYKKTIKRNKDSTVLEKIFIVDSGYIEERKFKKIKGKWFLVFYSFNDI